MPTPGTWSDDQNASLKKYWEEGYSASEIAREIHREYGINKSRNAIIGRLHRLGLSTPNGQKGVPKMRHGSSMRQRVDRIAARKAAGALKAKKAPEMATPSNESFLRLPIVELKPNQCRYAVDYAEQIHLFCGLPTDGRSYCEHHARICYGTNLFP